MELEEKLKNLAGFGFTSQRGADAPRSQSQVIGFLNGKMARNGFGEFVMVKRRLEPADLDRTSRPVLSGDFRGEWLARICSSKKSSPTQEELRSFDLREAVFLDCETTGLAGGVGTCAFLIGLGYISKDGFLVEQYFMQDFHQEKAILFAVMERLSQFRFLVSFNGKSYDLPLLENRWIVHRLDFDPERWLHLDLLFPCRRLWKRRIGECSLSNIEQKILMLRREIDVPSFLIPRLYFDYLRTGQAEPLVAVFRHNVYDVLSLLKLTVLIDRTLENLDQPGIEDPVDLYSLGKIFQKLKNYSASVKCFEQALVKGIPDKWLLKIKLNLASAYKKTGYMDKAMNIWEHLTEEDFPFLFSACEELAKYYEHGKKDYPKALSLVERALFKLRFDPSLSSVSGYQRMLCSLEYRRSRLERKIKKVLVLK